MVLVEFGAEVDFARGVTVVEDFDPGLDGSFLVEQGEGDLSLGDVDTLVAAVGVEDLDVELVGEVGDVEDGVLPVPGGVLATVLVNGGSPFLVADFQVNEGVHLVKDTALVVLEVGGLEVDVNVTVTGFGEDDDEDHLFRKIQLFRLNSKLLLYQSVSKVLSTMPNA